MTPSHIIKTPSQNFTGAGERAHYFKLMKVLIFCNKVIGGSNITAPGHNVRTGDHSAVGGGGGEFLLHQHC